MYQPFLTYGSPADGMVIESNTQRAGGGLRVARGNQSVVDIAVGQTVREEQPVTVGYGRSVDGIDTLVESLKIAGSSCDCSSGLNFTSSLTPPRLTIAGSRLCSKSKGEDYWYQSGSRHHIENEGSGWIEREEDV